MTHHAPILWCLIAAALFGVSTPTSKLLLGEVGPLTLAGLLYLGAALSTAPFSLRGGSKERRRDPYEHAFEVVKEMLHRRSTARAQLESAARIARESARGEAMAEMSRKTAEDMRPSEFELKDVYAKPNIAAV